MIPSEDNPDMSVSPIDTNSHQQRDLVVWPLEKEEEEDVKQSLSWHKDTVQERKDSTTSFLNKFARRMSMRMAGSKGEAGSDEDLARSLHLQSNHVPASLTWASKCTC